MRKYNALLLIDNELQVVRRDSVPICSVCGYSTFEDVKYAFEENLIYYIQKKIGSRKPKKIGDNLFKIKLNGKNVFDIKFSVYSPINIISSEDDYLYFEIDFEKSKEVCEKYGVLCSCNEDKLK